MVLLLDTHILLWALDTPRRLPESLRTTLADPDHEVCYSAASIWEIAVKAALKRVKFRYRPDEIAAAARQTGMVEVCVSASQAARVVDLPHHHRDPFDRLLIAQALSLPARLLTADAVLLRYSEMVQEVKAVSP
ncbi:MAG: type II toxin-antitoxin system VapC family toxin [Gammaproteobacteria bacterium]